jgi:hypothetical protein
MNQKVIIDYITENCEVPELLARTRSGINMYFFQKESVGPSNEDRERGRKEILSDIETKRISQVLNLLSFRDEIIQEHAILHIMQRSLKENTEIREKGGLKPIVELLNSSHPNIQLQAAKALSVMISYDEATLNTLAELNAFPTIVNNLLLPSSPKFMKFLQFIVYNLSLYEQHWDSLKNAGAIQAVCGILTENDEEATMKMAVKIIANLAADGANRQIAQQHGGLARIINLLDEAAPNYDIIKVLVHVSRTDEGCELILKYGAIPSLLRMLSYLKIEEDFLEAAALTPRENLETLDLSTPRMMLQPKKELGDISSTTTSSSSGGKSRKPRSSTSPAPVAQPKKELSTCIPSTTPQKKKKGGLFNRLLRVLDKSEITTTASSLEADKISSVEERITSPRSASSRISERSLQNKLLLSILKTIRNLSRNEACKTEISVLGGARLLVKYTYQRIPRPYMLKALKGLSALSSNSANVEAILSCNPAHLLALLSNADSKIFITSASFVTNVAESGN